MRRTPNRSARLRRYNVGDTNHREPNDKNEEFSILPIEKEETQKKNGEKTAAEKDKSTDLTTDSQQPNLPPFNPYATDKTDIIFLGILLLILLLQEEVDLLLVFLLLAILLDFI
ncbi:MAG: hypothetical protein H0Z35_06875 [Thermoanaerobacteraceae bacterium]|nr:hypothetical protein [Thermoanaerobacteraceae bacterium]